MQHPLALYPHLEESMPPDVFEDVVDILDPEMNMASDEENDDYLEDQETESQGTLHAQAPPSQQKAPPEEEKPTVKPECVFQTILIMLSKEPRDLTDHYRTKRNSKFHRISKIPKPKYILNRYCHLYHYMYCRAPEEGKIRNPYRWLPRKEEKDDKKDKKRNTERRSNSPSEVIS